MLSGFEDKMSQNNARYMLLENLTEKTEIVDVEGLHMLIKQLQTHFHVLLIPFKRLFSFFSENNAKRIHFFSHQTSEFAKLYFGFSDLISKITSRLHWPFKLVFRQKCTKVLNIKRVPNRHQPQELRLLQFKENVVKSVVLFVCEGNTTLAMYCPK